MVLFQIRHLEKSYETGFSLSIEHLDVRTGQLLGLLGPTGAGKSTLLKLLAGVDKPTGGQIRFGNAVVSQGGLPIALRRNIVMVHQRPLLLRGTVKQNVAYSLRLRGVRDRSCPVGQVLKRLGLADIADQPSHNLSGGQVQLVAVARALVARPAALVLDEPTAHLDPAHVALVEQAVQRFQTETGATVVWATHNLFQARRIARRTALLLDGQLAEEAETSAFFARPADPRTAAFIEGRMIY